MAGVSGGYGSALCGCCASDDAGTLAVSHAGGCGGTQDALLSPWRAVRDIGRVHFRNAFRVCEQGGSKDEVQRPWFTQTPDRDCGRMVKAKCTIIKKTNLRGKKNLGGLLFVTCQILRFAQVFVLGLGIEGRAGFLGEVLMPVYLCSGVLGYEVLE